MGGRNNLGARNPSITQLKRAAGPTSTLSGLPKRCAAENARVVGARMGGRNNLRCLKPKRRPANVSNSGNQYVV